MKRIIAATSISLGSALLGLLGLYCALVAVNRTLHLPESIPASQRRYKKSLERYTLPSVTLVNQDGIKVPIQKLDDSKRLVVVNFIYTGCTALSFELVSGYTNLQQELGPRCQDVWLVSITIDPENDTPKETKDYLKRFRAKPGWDVLTGKREDIDKVLNAFAAHMPNKAAHYPLTFFRSPKDGAWVRIQGLMGPSEFLDECHQAETR